MRTFDGAEAWFRVLMIDFSIRPVVCSAEAWIRPFETAGYQWDMAGLKRQ